MASSADFVAFIVDQVEPAGSLTARKMFGEYAIYARGRVVALVCDDRLFLKPTAGGRGLLGTPEEAPPYPGGKPWFVVEDALDDAMALSELFRVTALEVPEPAPKRPRKKGKAKRPPTPPEKEE
jgi:TfoX/Sxy family transcriptional regulator of competence genes